MRKPEIPEELISTIGVVLMLTIILTCAVCIVGICAQYETRGVIPPTKEAP